MLYKRRRTILILFLALIVSFLGAYHGNPGVLEGDKTNQQIKNSTYETPPDSIEALDILGKLAVKGRAPKEGYDRSMFMDGWRKEGSCDKRNIILKRDLRNTAIAENGCVVLSGVLYDPYTAADINFIRGPGTSDDVQVDHIVPLSDAWQKGAQDFSYKKRNNFANDPLNLLAVDGSANLQKSDGDAASWLPPNKIYRCAYAARQIAVKSKYGLWITKAEEDAFSRVLNNCPKQVLPITND
jgi:hypothetical protein